MGYNGFRPSNSVTYISVIRIKDPGCSEWLISTAASMEMNLHKAVGRLNLFLLKRNVSPIGIDERLSFLTKMELSVQSAVAPPPPSCCCTCSADPPPAERAAVAGVRVFTGSLVPVRCPHAFLRGLGTSQLFFLSHICLICRPNGAATILSGA